MRARTAILASFLAILFAPATVRTATCSDIVLPEWLSVSEPQSPKIAAAAFHVLDTHQVANLGFLPDFASDHREIDSTTEDFRGRWWFFGAARAVDPGSALRFQLPSRVPYQIHVELYCEPADCDRLLRKLALMSAPHVPGDDNLQDAWRRAVASEGCDPTAPVRLPKARYPEAAFRRGAEGVAEFSVYHNRCGDIRDARLSRSSGHADLDYAAYLGVLLRSRRIVPAAPNTAGWKQTTVSFRLSDASTVPYERMRKPH